MSRHFLQVLGFEKISIMNIKNHLRKYGYRPDLSDGILDKYEDSLAKYLSSERYEEFYYLRMNSTNNENHFMKVLNFIGEDSKLLRLALSSQLSISISLLQKVVDVIKVSKIIPKRVLELGGADGWALDYIDKKFNWSSELVNVEKYDKWVPKSKKITQLPISYAQFYDEHKYDLIFGILSCEAREVKDLIECISKHIDKGGIVCLGLRIAHDRYYREFIDLAIANGLSFDLNYCESIQVYDEGIPFMVLRKKTSVNSLNQKLRIVRKGFYNLLPEKRVFGFEANVLRDLLSEGVEIYSEERTFSDDNTLRIALIKKNEIVYRLVSNSIGDLIIEYPVFEDDGNNNIDGQIERFNLFKNTL